MGAASNYGKSSDLGINSPTHRSTHSEDLFGADVEVSKTIKSSSDIENIFDTDEFNPRAGEVAADFGDFESAFGKAAAALPSVPSLPASPANDFADFSSAFTTNVPSKATTQPLDDNFLFNSPPAPVAVPIVPIAKSNDITADLFGNSVITSAFQPVKSDLLDDFADLKINTGSQGEFYYRSILLDF